MQLPVPGDSVLVTLLRERRSTKAYVADALGLSTVADALWVVAGRTRGDRRVVPSARATYPVHVTLVAGAVTGLDAGVWEYDPDDHGLRLVRPGDHREALADVTLDAAGWMSRSPAQVVLSTLDDDTVADRFPDQPDEHATAFVWAEVGHAAQNLYLWAAEQGLGTAVVAGLDDTRAAALASRLLPEKHRLLAVLPLGHPA